jgi:hypothetical protein
MTSEIAEDQRTRLRVENQKEMQTNATCEQTAAKSPDAEARVEMRCAQAVAHSPNNFADLSNCRFGTTQTSPPPRLISVVGTKPSFS